MLALSSILEEFWHPSYTLRTQELPTESAVFNSEEDLAPLSHFTDPGAPECERCVQSARPKGIRRVGLSSLNFKKVFKPLQGSKYPAAPSPSLRAYLSIPHHPSPSTTNWIVSKTVTKCSGGARCIHFSIQNAQEEPAVCIFRIQNAQEEPDVSFFQFKMPRSSQMYAFFQSKCP